MSDQNTQMLGEIAAIISDDVPKEICLTTDAVRWLRDAYRSACIRDAKTPDHWRPIETAPKDGTAILFIDEDTDIPHPVRWENTKWLHAWDGEEYPTFGKSWWMPLPPAPKPRRWWCKRCDQEVDMKLKRCGCDTSPSPWEPLSNTKE